MSIKIVDVVTTNTTSELLYTPSYMDNVRCVGLVTRYDNIGKSE